MQLVAHALDLERRAGAETEISWSPATGSSSDAASVTTLGEVDRARAAARGRRRRARAAAGRRPAGASGGDERSAEAAASRCSPSSVSSSSSRLASTEVSGVRSSCEASATNSRWRASAASVSARASSSACEHRLERASRARRPRRRPPGAGCAPPGRACARSRARRRSARRSAPSRGARWPGRPAARARRRRARRGRGTASRGWPSRWTSEIRRPYCAKMRKSYRRRESRRSQLARLDPPAVDLVARARGGPKFGAPVELAKSRPSPVTTRIAALLAAAKASRSIGYVVLRVAACRRPRDVVVQLRSAARSAAEDDLAVEVRRRSRAS